MLEKTRCMCYNRGMAQIKDNLAANLRALRKSRSLTQMELAETLHYSDKSVSKWEHGDAMPDIEVLAALAAFYGVTVDYLIAEHADNEAVPAEEAGGERKLTGNRRIITLLAVAAVWIAVTAVYVALLLAHLNIWQLFVWAVPASAVVLIVFYALWGRRRFSPVLTSVLVWTLLLSAYLQFLRYNLWMLAIVGVPLQIAVVLWAKLKKRR